MKKIVMMASLVGWDHLNLLRNYRIFLLILAVVEIGLGIYIFFK